VKPTDDQKENLQTSMSKIDLEYYEKVIVYKILTDDNYLASVIDFIDSKYFADTNISSVVSIIQEFYDKHSHAPTLTEIKSYLVTDDLKSKYKVVVGYLQDAIEPGLNHDELVENTERFFREKAVYNTLMEVAEKCNGDGDVDTSNILDQFEKACGISLKTDLGFDILNQIDKHIEELNERDKTIPTAWNWLDEKLDGGLLEDGRALYVFAGETNIGKSIVLGNVAVNIAKQNKVVLLVSLEMSEKMYTKRLTSSISSIPINNLSSRTDELRTQLLDFKQQHHRSRLLVKEFPPNTITVPHLKNFIQKIVNTGVTPDCIVIDYVNLLHDRTGNNSYERIKHATEKLRALSYVFSCPIVTATQLNRQGYNESNPSLDTVSESIGLAATADAIFSLWQEEEDAELGIIRMGLMKNRFGPNFGSTAMQVNYSTLTITEDETLNVGDDSIHEVDAESMMNLLS